MSFADDYRELILFSARFMPPQSSDNPFETAAESLAMGQTTLSAQERAKTPPGESGIKATKRKN